MSATRFRKRRQPRSPVFVQKPRGVVHPRVQRVGPEHFGVVCIDCAKARFKWMLCDFYGNVLVAPTVVAHNRVELDAALAQLRRARADHDIQDLVVAVERTGRYHHVPRRAFAQECHDVRTVHPFTTKQFRRPSDPGVKTDDTDLAAIFRAAINGFALVEAEPDPRYRDLQLSIRHRRDLVRKNAAVCCQLREHLDAAFPGYAACFSDFWDSAVALPLVHHFDSAEALLQAGTDGLRPFLRQRRVRFQHRTLDTVLAWAAQAAPADTAARRHRQIALALDDDRTRKTQEIQAAERAIASQLVHTPYLMLLSFPGINVVSAADFAGEMGAISNYASGKAITGRAGLFPSRYQSDRVDHQDGPLVSRANRALRAAILGIADNLIGCNRHFGMLTELWRAKGHDPRLNHVRVACRFCRIAFHMVAGQHVFKHPSMQQRHYILDKLGAFHRTHDTPMNQTMADLLAAIDQLPRSAHAEEAEPLRAELDRIQAGRRRGPQLLGDILPIVLARLGVGTVQSLKSGESDSA
jgi:transposase